MTKPNFTGKQAEMLEFLELYEKFISLTHKDNFFIMGMITALEIKSLQESQKSQ